MVSNYEKQAMAARKLFLNYDQEIMIEKFGLERDDVFLYLSLLDGKYRISREKGTIETEKEKGWISCLDYQIVMTIYDVLCYSEKRPVLSGQWCPLYNLQVTMSSPDADTFTGAYADRFAGRTARLKGACLKLGGEIRPVIAGADLICLFPVFPFFPVLFRFWDGDDEFDAKIQFLWDHNSLDFMHFETLYYVIRILLERISAEME